MRKETEAGIDVSQDGPPARAGDLRGLEAPAALARDMGVETYAQYVGGDNPYAREVGRFVPRIGRMA